MSRAARSLLVFGVYLIALGLTLAVAPNVVTRAVGVAQTDEPWLRLVGAVVLNVGVYYCLAARGGLRPIIVASVPARVAIMLWLVGFVAFTDADAAILVFGTADLIGALWTIVALRADRSSALRERSRGAP